MSRARRQPGRSDARHGRPAGGASPGAPGPALAVRLLVVLLGVGLLVAAVHGPVLDARALSLDDNEYLTDNPLVRNPGWSSAGRFLAEVLAPSTVHGYYQPLTMISLMLDVARGGGPGNLRPFHETSLVLHVLNVWLVILLLYALFGRLGVAACVGLLFGIHPLTVEPIAWVADRKTLLAACFSLASLLAYLLHARSGSRAWYALSLGLFPLALMSKPTATLLPAAMLLLDLWPLDRLKFRAVVEKVPFVLLAAVSGVITLVSQARTASVDVPGSQPLATVLSGLVYKLGLYAAKLAWPVGLTPVYPHPEPMSFANPRVLAALVLVLLAGLGVLASLRRTRSWAVSAGIFMALLLPTLGGIGFTVVIASDKYVYLPAIGLLIFAARAAAGLFDRFSARSGAMRARLLAGSAVLLLAVLECIGVRSYLPRWSDSMTLELYMVERAPRSPLVHYNLGLSHEDKGDLAAAMGEFRRALELEPRYAPAYNNLGKAFIQLNQPAEAAVHFRRAVELRPDLLQARENLANVLAMQGDYPSAFAHYEAVLKARPDSPDTHRNYGFALHKAGRPGPAAEHLARAVGLGVDDARVHHRLGMALADLGRIAEALREFERAARLAPDWAEPRQQADRIVASAPAGR